MLPLLLLLACHPPAEVVDACVEDPGLCAPCAGSHECVFMGNPCTDTVFCAQQDASIAVVAIGCSSAIERSWPDDRQCQCVEAVCQSVDGS